MNYFVFHLCGILTFCASVCLCNEDNETDKLRIVNGNTADEGQFPFMASLRTNNYHFCGGSIINKRWILTAAHCLVSYSPNQVEVIVGTNYLNKNEGDRYQACKIFTNAGFINFSILSTLGYDIGLIKVKTEIIFGPKVQPIKLSNDYLTGNGKKSTIMGWGVNHANAKEPMNALQYLKTNTLNIFMCRLRLFSPLPKSFVCITHKYGQGACFGDSGSPLVTDNVQTGIAAMVIPCGVGYPDMYTQVSYHLPWIKHIIAKN